MKFTSKLLTLLLALVMVLALIPAVAQAQEASAETVTEHIPFRVNPLYEGIITEEDLDIPELPETEPNENFTHSNYYYTIEQAAGQLRSKMMNREETFTICVQAAERDYEVVADEMAAIALEHTGNPTEGDYLMWQYGGLGGEVTRSYNSTTEMYEFTYNFVAAYLTNAEQEREVTTAVNNLISNLGIRYKTDYEKIKAVYDWLCQNVTYDSEYQDDATYILKHTAYGALIDNTAASQGYALLFYRLMLELNVDSRVIGGLDINGETCNWNIVQLGDFYYNVDSALDAGQEECSFFLINTWNFVDHFRFLDYESMDFHSEFPMAAEDYDPDVAAEIDPYIYISICGDNANWALMRDGTLNIVGTGPMDNYMLNYGSLAGMAPWQFWAGDVTKVDIGEGITEIGNYAFYEQTGLTEVSLPSTLTKLGMNSFDNCTSLTAVQIPDGVTWIGQFAFNNCNSLLSVTIPDSVTRIDTYAFQECDSLAQLDLGNGVQTIGGAAFQRCNALTEVHIPNSVTNLGSSVFSQCENLQTVTIDCAVVPAYTFEACGNLKNVTFTNNVTTIENTSFYNCRSIEELVFPDSITSLSGFGGCTGLKRVVLPANMTTINSNAFSGCSSLETIVFPEKLECIESQAFAGCRALTQLDLPDTLTSISGGAFSNCDGLVEITFPESVTTINGFSECDKLTVVNIPDTATTIGRNAFGYCRSLTTIHLPEGIITIDDSAFRECTALTDIQIPSTVTTIGYYSFAHCESLKEITIPSGVTSLQGFNFCKNLETVHLYNSGVIANGAFESCQNLKNLHFYGDITEIQGDAFENCDSLTEITLPDSIRIVNGFSECDGLTFIDLGKCVKIDGYAFYDCSNLKEVIIPDTVTSIGGAAFQYCSSLKEITIPASVGSVGANAFYGTGLETVYLNNKGEIQSYAFSSCGKLTTVVMAEGVTNIGVMAFGDCPALTEITIPATVTYIGSSAFRNCKALAEITFCGDAPEMSDSIFQGVTATAYYPQGNETWTEDKLQNYGGNITWESYVPPCPGHEYTSVVTAPTCIEQGYTTYTCELCGYSYADNYVDALGHDMSEWVTTKEATCTEEGSKQKECSRCDHSETEIIPTKAHEYEDGHCKWCGKEQGQWGDVDGNGKVNHNDARLVLQHYVGAELSDSIDLSAADVDGNGKINHNDARLILQFYVGVITGFPVEEQ